MATKKPGPKKPGPKKPGPKKLGPTKPGPTKPVPEKHSAITVPEPVARVLALFDRMEASLKAHKGVKLTKTAKVKPVPEAEIAAWEAKHGMPLPADYRGFLLARGGFDLEWKAKKKAPNGTFHGARFKVVGPPKVNSLFPDLFIFRDDSDLTLWNFRMKPGTPSVIVVENIPDSSELRDLSGTFSEFLLEELSWFGVKSDAGDAQVPVGADGLRNFSTLHEMLVNPPELDPTSADSLMRAMESTDDLDSEAWRGLIALGATQAVPKMLERVHRRVAGTDMDLAEAATALRDVWKLDPKAVTDIAAAIRAKPPTGDFAESLVAVADAICGDRKRLLAAVERAEDHLVGSAQIAVFEALISLGDPASIRAAASLVVGRCRGPDGFRMVRLLAAHGHPDGFRAIAASLTGVTLQPEEEPDDLTDKQRAAYQAGRTAYLLLRHLSEHEGWRVGLDPWGKKLEAARTKAIAWLEDLATRVTKGAKPDELPIEWPVPEYVVKAKTEQAAPGFQVPALVYELESREPDSLAPLAAFVGLRRLSIYVDPDRTPPLDFSALSTLTDLEWLEIVGSVGPEANLEALAALPSLRKLRVRGDRNGGILAEGAERLVKALSAGLPRLEMLDLARNKLGDGGVSALATSPAVARLVMLMLDNTAYTKAGAKALSSSSYLRGCDVQASP
jgi:hypothetical protein